MPAVGDRVTYHLVPAHRCGGHECRCAVLAFPARVIGVHDDGSLALVVELDDEAIALGYSTTQSRAPVGASGAPESGSWT